MGFLTLGYDHRLVDGAVADQFMADLKKASSTSIPCSCMTPLQVRRLGLVPYADGLELQRRLVEERKADRIPIRCCCCSIPTS